METRLLDADRMTIEPRTLTAPVALLSLDVETDYGSGRHEALSQVGRLLDVLAEQGVPLTAFVEGQLFARDRPLCRSLLDWGADVQLHCYDHAESGDTLESLRRGVAAFADCCGRPPSGYRAHTYRLTHELYGGLRELGFAWDSSLQRAWGRGSQRHPRLLDGDYLVFDGWLYEFPVGTWRRAPLPFTHPYRLLLKTPGDWLMWTLGGGPGRLVTYNMHMTDLVRSDSLRHAADSRLFRTLQRCAWCAQGENTFGALRAAITRLRRAGWEFLSTSALHERVSR